jgi:hypothetical protein
MNQFQSVYECRPVSRLYDSGPQKSKQDIPTITSRQSSYANSPSGEGFAPSPEPATEARWPTSLRDVAVAVADRATPALNRRALPWQTPHAIGPSVHPARETSTLLPEEDEIHDRKGCQEVAG